jgi:phospholipase C
MLHNLVRSGLFRLTALAILFSFHFASAQTALITVSNSAALTITTNIPVPESSGDTYILEKFAPGRLTVSGQITGGAGSVLRTTTDTPGDTTTVLEFTGTNSAYIGDIQLAGGSVLVDNPLALGTGTIYADSLGSAPGDLVFNANMTFTNALVLQSIAASISPGTNDVTFGGVISGPASLTEYGSGVLTLTSTNTYTGSTTISGSTLELGPRGTLGSGAVLDLGTLSFNRPDDFTVPNDIAGSGGCRQNGSGTVTLSGNLSYLGPTLVNAGILALPGNVTFDASSGAVLDLGSGAAVNVSSTVFNLNANSSGVAVDVMGAGTLRLVSTLNSIETFSDINFGPNQTGTADFGCRLAANLDLGSIHRTIYGWSGANDVARNNLSGADCQLAGTISGTAELTLQGQNSFDGVNTMEVPFVLLASNSFTGPLEIQRGSVYLGNANALVCSNALIFDAPDIQNSRLFLYGFNASISDLQSSGIGNALIADGNNITTTNVGPAMLTVTQNNPFSFTGTICDWYTEYTAPVTGPLTPILSLVKNGAASLTLTGSNTYSGTTTINAGTLYINGGSSGPGAIFVNSNATLGGSSVINSTNVIVRNKGIIETGSGVGAGNLQLSRLTLGNATTDQSTLNLTPAAQLNVTQSGGLVINSGTHSVAINVGGTILSSGAYPLITYQGTPGGTGFNAFSLRSVPPGVSGILSNDVARSSIDLFVIQVTSAHWTGAASSQWSTNTIPSPKNWVFSTGPSQIDYADGEPVTFDDSAVNPLVNINTVNVSPFAVTVSNNATSYVMSGNYGIAGATGLAKEGSGSLLLSTTNSYTGPTIIAGGTLVLGTASAVPGGPSAGNVTVNSKVDVAGFSPTFNNLSGAGVIDNVSAGGSPIVSIYEQTNSSFSGVIRNTTGNMGLNLTGGGALTLSGSDTYSGPTTVADGTLLVNGSLATSKVTVLGGAYLGGSGTIQGTATLAANANLDVTANVPLAIGALTLNGPVIVNVSGAISTTNAAIYTLLNHGSENGTGSFVLSAVPGILNSKFTASLNDTNNQLQLVIAPARPSGTIKDVQHVVIFMQENRSFDHYFGTLHGVHGFSDRYPLMFQNGRNAFYQPTSGTNYELPFHNTETCLTDVPHDWVSTHQAINSGKNNQWITAKGTETMNYDVRSDIPYYYALADAFTVCDEYHCSALTSTFPNRLYLWTGMIDPNDTGGGPVINNTTPSGGWAPAWVTYPEFLQRAGVSWKVYEEADHANDNALTWFETFEQAQPGDPLYDNGMATVPDLVTALKNDVAANTLPCVSWIVGPGASDEHPPHSPQSGEALTKSLLDAIASNPTVYDSTVFILLYDENDGFFDHEIPILPPAGTTNEFVGGLPIGLGVRIPFIIVSPWTRGGYVCSQVFDATSVIQFLEKWTGVMDPNISAWRRQACGDLTSAFDFAHPNTNYPSLVSVAAINCSRGSTPPVPTTQTMPVQESGTLIQRPLPYQPNTTSYSDLNGGNFDIVLTNSGTASVHYTIYANAYRTDGPWPYDVGYTNSSAAGFNVLTTSGNYDLTCYGPNGFMRRFAGNINSQHNQIEVSAVLNPATGNTEVFMTNGTSATITINLTNNYANSGKIYSVPATGTRVIEFLSSTNNGWYDLAATLNGSTNFLRKFAGHIETNSQVDALVSSENPSGYKDNVKFSANLVGYGVPTGTVQFKTNGIAWGNPIASTGGIASLSIDGLPPGTNTVSAEYSGDTLNLPWTNSLAQIVTNQSAADYFDQTNRVTLNISTTNVALNFFGVAGDQYIVERSTNLTCGSCWVPISTNTAPANGPFAVKDNFQDLGVPLPPLPQSVYYRLRYDPPGQ